MFLSPSPQWTGEDRRRRCMRTVYPSIILIVEKAHLAGWSREEVLIAIADAADSQLGDATEAGSLIDTAYPHEERAGTCAKVTRVPK
jgi:hypothetical protein